MTQSGGGGPQITQIPQIGEKILAGIGVGSRYRTSESESDPNVAKTRKPLDFGGETLRRIQEERRKTAKQGRFARQLKRDLPNSPRRKSSWSSDISPRERQRSADLTTEGTEIEAQRTQRRLRRRCWSSQAGLSGEGSFGLKRERDLSLCGAAPTRAAPSRGAAPARAAPPWFNHVISSFLGVGPVSTSRTAFPDVLFPRRTSLAVRSAETTRQPGTTPIWRAKRQGGPAFLRLSGRNRYRNPNPNRRPSRHSGGGRTYQTPSSRRRHVDGTRTV